LSFDLIVRGGMVVLPGQPPQPLDVAVNAGKVAALLAPGGTEQASRVVDAGGLAVLPGILDVHVHLGHGADISRPRDRNDAAVESAAAASGGVTTMIPYILAAEEHSTIFEGIRDVTSAGSHIDFGYHLIISNEAQLAAVPDYVNRLGVASFKIFMNNRNGEGARLGLPDIDDAFLFRLAEACAATGAVLCPHPENIEVAQYLRAKVMKADPDGSGGLSSWNATRPPFVEADAVQRAARFSRIAGNAIYIVHTSSAEALAAARAAREEGADIVIETCPHYLTHDVDSACGDMGKINPPLRERADCDALWDGIASGLVDTVASDHVHRDLSSKNGGIWKASPGCPGMETLLPVMLTEGYHRRGIPLERIVSLLSEKPSRSMGLWGRKGALLPGFDADMAIVDLAAEYHMARGDVLSSAGYSIYEGWALKGRVARTLVRGVEVFRDGAVVAGTSGHGTYLSRSLGA
jgi:dihydropyrimidinase